MRLGHALDGWAVLALALAVTTASAAFVRPTAEQVTYNNECLAGPDPERCYEARLGGGLPFAYLLDTPGVSVERSVYWGEDELRTTLFWLDVGVWAALVLGGLAALRRVRGAPEADRLGVRFGRAAGAVLVGLAALLALRMAALSGGWGGGAVGLITDPFVLPPMAAAEALPVLPDGVAFGLAAALWVGGLAAVWVRVAGSPRRGTR